ncbi:hypothetical protein KKC83_02105 [Patescibacteria group bacterium]|nr:hypothetical protein [Candidatus Falkowbacteria bacterium]MBU3905541.1 hypothetical protein [Patescibacteria group bacterium]MCG2698625.1 hypothetical protein [Candidatus Parcubacteria bacterium]MBU4015364.1 hypothetical protein [Patescibacteria group bacterium]MBU4026318.1 hypothetical protein [Patescibacteria group bacterium]
MSTITIPKKIEQDLKNASFHFGISKEDFLINATLYYLEILKEKLELNKEFNAWEKTSDNDLLKFEKNL